MNKQGKIALIAILSAVLGAVSSAVIWLILKVMSLGMDFLWTILPAKLGAEHNLAYMLAVTIIGGIIIGLWQKKFGLLPEELPQVMGRVKKEGSYPYDNLHILIVSALLPLIFGGVIGPEAGLTGVIVGLCCWIGDRLKCKGDELAALAQSSMGAALGLFSTLRSLESCETWASTAKRRRKNTAVCVWWESRRGSLSTVWELPAA